MKTGHPAEHGFDEIRLERIKIWMERYVGERKFAGSGVLIARGGEIVFDHATGLRDVENGYPFERDTIARIYSMTKPVTATAIMMLIEQGLFHLDMPVSEFIPAFSDMCALVPGAQSIDQVEKCATPTLHQLMTHTSGLSYPFNPGVLAREMDSAKVMFNPNQGPLGAMVDRVARLPLAFQPGKRWEYSVATDVLGRIVEIVSGTSLGAFFQEQIFAPLGMNETGFSVPSPALDRFASLYTPLEGSAMALNAAKAGQNTLRLVDHSAKSPFRNAVTLSGGGGLVGTMDDYLRFIEMLRLGGALGAARLLSPKTVAFMMRNHLPGDIASMGPESFAEQPMEGMGFGLAGAVMLDPALARSFGNAGDFMWGGMASTFFWIDRSLDMCVVFFTQLSPSSSYPARAELKALVHGAILQ